MNTGDGVDSRSPGTKSDPDRSQSVSRRLVSLAEAAATLSISIATARRLVRSGRLPVVRLSRRLLLDTRDLDILISGSKERVGW